MVAQAPANHYGKLGIQAVGAVVILDQITARQSRTPHMQDGVADTFFGTGQPNECL